MTKRDMLARHGLQFEWARLLFRDGVKPLEIARRTGLTVEQVDRLVAAEKKETVT
ncbi:MAG: hypothetical protein AAFY24_01985 [Pseudomonadota bacterium]